VPTEFVYVLDLMSDSNIVRADFLYAPLPQPDTPPPPGEGFDFGDAPDSEATPRYPTLAINGGASHKVTDGLFLGSQVDGDADGRPTAEATGDDSIGFDDEDGVVFVSDLAPGQFARVEVTASAPGRLDAFIDTNGDGDWNDNGEKFLGN